MSDHSTSPRRFRFDLRTLFVVTAVVAALSAAFRVHPLLTAVALDLIAITAAVFLAARPPGDLQK